MSRRIEYRVTAQRAGQKVSTVLQSQMGLSGTVMRRIKWLEDGILLDGTRVFLNQKVEEGQLLSALVGERVDSDMPAIPGAVDICYEDEDLLVVNKEAGLPCHSGPHREGDSLGNYLLYYYQTQGWRLQYHPVHRLDKGTSGLMVVAKHPHAQEQLKRQLHTGQFRRVYLAICDGIPSATQGVIEAPLGRGETGTLGRVVHPDGQQARTHYQVLQTGQNRALVQLELETGRTHQIRVHMAHIGYPLTGDFLYGVEQVALIGRPALHSAQLWITQPLTGQEIFVEASLPQDMKGLLDGL